MADRNCADARDEVEIAFSGVVEEILHVSFTDEKGSFVVVEVEVRHVLLSVFDHLFESRASVSRWLEVDGRQG